MENRLKEVQELVCQVLDKDNRCIDLVGVSGIGKSSVLKFALHYMNDRKFFTGGIIYINLKHHKSFGTLEKQLKSIILKALNL